MNSLLSVLKTCGENLDIPFAIADIYLKDQELVFVNQAFEELSGYKANEVEGRNCRFLQGNDTNQKTRKQIKERIMSCDSSFFDILNYKKDGTPFWNRLVIFPVQVDESKPRYFVGVQIEVDEDHSIQKFHKLENAGKVEQKAKNPFLNILRNYRAMEYNEFFDSKNSEDDQKYSHQLKKEITQEIARIKSLLHSV